MPMDRSITFGSMASMRMTIFCTVWAAILAAMGS